MGSVKLKDLKTFVRYDGSGRVVSGSLVFRKKKPKNGRWGEITKNLCCTESGTTTTTTTQGGGGVTPTAFVKSFWSTVQLACSTTAEGTMIFYSSSPTLQAGIEIFYDAALTIHVPYGYVIYPADMTPNLEVSGVNGLLTNLVCL